VHLDNGQVSTVRIPFAGTMKSNLKWILVLLVLTLLFYWKIVFTSQFSISTSEEIANQAYCWYNFSAKTVQQGILPLWDPFVAAGRSFVGGMEAGLFYPLKWLLYLWPMGSSGQLSPRLFQDFVVLAHFLAACLMFLLVRDMGLSPFSALAAGLTFGMGGLVGRAPWPDMIDSAVWLPLVVLFLRRALKAGTGIQEMLYSSLSGTALGLAILAGRIHIVVMDVIVVVTAVVYFACRPADEQGRSAAGATRWIGAVKIVAVVGVISFCIGAVQLLPSVELSQRAVRYIGADAPTAASERIAYVDLKEELWPRGLFTLLFFTAYPGSGFGGEHIGLYIGVFPFILAVAGIWRNWDRPWVRYLSVLAVAAYAFTLGSYSLLHGLAYLLVPYLWIARGASRFVYISQFAMAILAGYGAETIFVRKEGAERFATLLKIMKWSVALMAIPMLSAAMTGKPEPNEWISLSFLLVVASCALFYYVVRGHATPSTRFVAIFLIMFDLSAFCWTIQNRASQQKVYRDYYQNLVDCSGLAEFLRSRPGLFRVHIDNDYAPNIGDMYSIQTTRDRMATELKEYLRFRLSAPRNLDQLNVRYVLRGKALEGRPPAYSDRNWRVYENPDCLPRAWLVHKAVLVPKPDMVIPRMKEPDFDPRQVAVVSQPIEAGLVENDAGMPEEARVVNYRPNSVDITVKAATPALLILSEVDYPGWKATVNGKPVPIHKVNGLLRGILVSTGESRVLVHYSPGSVLFGAILSLAGLAFTAGLLICAKYSKASS
jgi:uncharacterized membrane protein YfhO